MVDKSKPSGEEVRKFHENSDRDGSLEASHHSLGMGLTQASPGQHSHDGGSSKLILDGMAITGSRTGSATIPSIIAALVRLGISDNSSA